MEMRLTFKGSGEDHVARIHPEIRWTRIVISHGWKLTTAVRNFRNLTNSHYLHFYKKNSKHLDNILFI